MTAIFDLRQSAFARSANFYEDELAEAYLQVNDKAYLELIVKKIMEDAQTHASA